MSTPASGGRVDMITVDVADDPRAPEPVAGHARRRRPWLWVIAVLAVLAVGATVLLWPNPEPGYRPPELDGLAGQPSMSWQRELDGPDQWATVVGETVAVHPSSWRGGELIVEVLDPADGEVLWAADYSGHVEWHPVLRVQVRDLPATPYLAVEISRLAQEPYMLLLVERDSGDVKAAHEMQARSALFSTDTGRFLLLQEMGPTFGDETVTQLALLRSHDPGDEVWRVDTGRYYQESGLLFLERGGFIGLGSDWPGFHSSTLDAVFSVVDGSPPPTAGFGPTVFAGDVLVHASLEGIGALDVGSGTERWQRECHCMPHEVGGELFTVEWNEQGSPQLMRVDVKTGSDLWPAPAEMDAFGRILRVGDQFVWIAYIDEGTHISGATVSVLDVESGQLGELRGDVADAGLAWDAGEHLVMWDGLHTLIGVPVDDHAEPWEYGLPESSALVLDAAAGRLVVFDQTNHTVGALGDE